MSDIKLLGVDLLLLEARREHLRAAVSKYGQNSIEARALQMIVDEAEGEFRRRVEAAEARRNGVS